ncbi:MAG TPA: iron-containing redox enzyme family protein [Terriglobales bacterium]|jgi:pyrroloquinoline-quinone synthase|nr:iron-containing redox enzyme family protein [Terriglobales bacterium]
MDVSQFFNELDERIRKYDLLCHPFYQAWSSGKLTNEDLREYAQDYYPHVQAFPTYLAEFGVRLPDGEMRRAVLANMSDEKGGEDVFGEPARSHAELWLDFVEGMGAPRSRRGREAAPAMKRLMMSFHHVAAEGMPEEALAAFYAHESQVPRIAEAKEEGLRSLYGADATTYGYFTLHKTADVYHSNVWKQQLGKAVNGNPAASQRALDAAEAAAKALWQTLDGIEAERMARAA